jgi:hypothetical protein
VFPIILYYKIVACCVTRVLAFVLRCVTSVFPVMLCYKSVSCCVVLCYKSASCCVVLFCYKSVSCYVVLQECFLLIYFTKVFPITLYLKAFPDTKVFPIKLCYKNIYYYIILQECSLLRLLQKFFLIRWITKLFPVTLCNLNLGIIIHFWAHCQIR